MIVVIGATGMVGREVVTQLHESGAKVTAVTRDATAAQLPPEITVVQGDPSVPVIPRDAWSGVEAVLLSSRAVVATAPEILSTAAEYGARRVVVVSAATVEYPAGEPRFIAGFRALEAAAAASGLAWTSLRCSDFDANTFAWIPQLHGGDVVRGAYGKAATSPIHERDIAAVAVRALTSEDHAGRHYVLTGPQSLTQYDKVRLLGDAIGRDLSFLELPPEQVRAAMTAQGLPEDIPARLLGSLADYTRVPGPTTDTVEELLGRPALGFSAWAAEHAAAFRR
ncbi:NAD(P)H-binding protein [Nocardia brasiliensis]|uniref:NmrA family protein n=1 Tax=Nocardia brasiliensis (strain ATCC 700358 / HUJEG-1) TaxID=1133849 RepID=K0F6B9_NOCB7|nr:NAD(P)H-binding protein [Nocardia brasiliensis]AFU05224.1 NmrA family protein [Nocardia brasiliensis ATCC 700358]OCF88048.1 NmrA family transcriptional regulator [Nocardia brasiliensis]